MARPDIDDELLALLDGLPLPTELDTKTLARLRAVPPPPVAELISGRGAGHREVAVTTRDGATLTLPVFTPAGVTGPAPCVYWIHGGGMVMGDRFSQIDIPLEWLDRFGAVMVSVDYRLAPEARGATLVEDHRVRVPHLGRRRRRRAARLGGRVPRFRRVVPAGAHLGRRPAHPLRLARPHPAALAVLVCGPCQRRVRAMPAGRASLSP